MSEHNLLDSSVWIAYLFEGMFKELLRTRTNYFCRLCLCSK